MADESFDENPIAFKCHENILHGIISQPKKDFNRAVIIVVGGPQFRVGSHRQFVLLARYLAERGVLVLRFDYTGMGYSGGIPKQFYQIDDDIKAATDFIVDCYSNIQRIYLWGLCDAASAISFAAYTDTRINGIIISNPWVRSDASHSEAILKNYYRERILSVDVWKELLSSPFKVIRAIISLLSVSFKVVLNLISFAKKDQSVQEITIGERKDNLAAAVLTGLSRFNGKICLLLSENDLTADEFKREFESSGWMSDVENSAKIIVHDVPHADHTFSSQAWRNKVEELTMDFVSV